MIVPMKKASVIVQSKDSNQTLQLLRSLGVLHVEHQNPPKAKDISLLHDEVMMVDKVLGILSMEDQSGRSLKKDIKDMEQWTRIAKNIVDLRNRLDQLEEYSATLRNSISQWETWGDFNPSDISRLAEKNIYVRLYQIPAKDIKYFPPSVIAEIMSIAKGVANCVAISREKVEIPFKELPPPKMSPSEMRKRLAEDREVFDKLKSHLARHARYYDDFLSIKKFLRQELEFSEALHGMGQAGRIVYIVGYVPRDKVEAITEAAKRYRWGIFVSDPSDEDMVPTLIRNPGWISMIKPVFKLIEVVPGYKELDISLWFLVFLSIFYGMLMGDAGYGAILLGLTGFAHWKFGKKIREKSIFTLFYILNACAVIWGLLTGTIFGQEWLGQTVKPLMPALKIDKNIQTLCFFLGAFHLSIAHMWRAILKVPSIRALADVGWTVILWGGFFLARMLILGDAFPWFGKHLFVIGCLFVIFFTEPRRNILKGVGSGLGTLLLSLVNSFTDVVSYIRLFAVGLAAVAIADAFNTMAMSVGFSNIISSLITVTVLLLGHTLNIILGPLAVIVHGVRLNVLEFCSHVDIKWNGFSYRPLKEEKLEAGYSLDR